VCRGLSRSCHGQNSIRATQTGLLWTCHNHFHISRDSFAKSQRNGIWALEVLKGGLVAPVGEICPVAVLGPGRGHSPPSFAQPPTSGGFKGGGRPPPLTGCILKQAKI